MSSLILLFLCLFLGFYLRRIKIFPENGHLALNSFVINISLSALALFYIPKIRLSYDVLFPVAIAWLNIGMALLFFGFLGKRLGWKKTLTGAVIMCAGFGNTSFVGIPVIQALFGDEGIKTVMLVDQPGSFVALSTVGIAVANYYSGGNSTYAEIFRKILRFPPFIAFTVAVLLNILQIQIPQVFDTVLEKLGATTVPLALFSVGSQLKFEKPGEYARPLFLGLMFKLILFPLAVFILYFIVLGQRGETVEISLMEAAMAPMITAAIIASAHNLESRLCSLFVGIGIPLSLITLGLWYAVLQLL